MSITQEFKNVSIRNGTILAEVDARESSLGNSYGKQSILVSARMKRESHLSFQNQVYIIGYEDEKEVFMTELTDVGTWSILPMYSYTPQTSKILVQLVASGNGVGTGELTVSWQRSGTMESTVASKGRSMNVSRSISSAITRLSQQARQETPMQSRRSSSETPLIREIKPLSVSGEVWCPSEGSSSIVPIYRRPRSATTLPVGGVSPAMNNNMTTVRFT